MFEVNIYLETSLKGPGTRKGWHAAVLEYKTRSKGVVIREDFTAEEETTFHKSALCALIKSLKRLNTSCSLIVHTDCMYLVNSHDNHLPTWEKNGFLSSRHEEVKNREQWQEVSKLLKGHKVLFVYEKNHTYTKHMIEKAKHHLGEATEMV